MFPRKRGDFRNILLNPTGAMKEGYKAIIAFVIQGEGISEVRPNKATDPEFTRAYEQAVRAGVQVLFLQCKVKRTVFLCVLSAGMARTISRRQ